VHALQLALVPRVELAAHAPGEGGLLGIAEEARGRVEPQR
jgi:hypothetical protein